MTETQATATRVIDAFRGAHFFLSNFYGSPITEHDITYPTVEHYFQAQKTLDPTERQRIAATPTAKQAKGMGRRVALIPDWDAIKLSAMRRALDLKFEQSSSLAWLLLGTGDALLREGNQWGDRFWGVDGQVGANWLGHLLMARRAELRAG